MSEEQYFIRVRGRVQGPFDLDRLHLLAKRGQFSRLHEVSSDGTAWSRASDHPELFPAPAETARRVPVGKRAAEAAAPNAAAPPEPPLEWFYSRDGSQLGPVALSSLSALLAAGQLCRDDMVWKAGLPSWLPLSEVVPAGGPSQGAAPPIGPGERRDVRSPRRFSPAMRAALLAAVVIIPLGMFGILVIGVGAWFAFRSGDTDEVARNDKKPSAQRRSTKARAQTKPKTPSPGAASPDSGDTAAELVNGPEDDDGLRGAVGRVFLGLSTSQGDELPLGSGTGFNVSKDGYFITNNHVVSLDLDEWEKDDVEALGKWIQSKKDAGANVTQSIWVFFGRSELYNATVVKKFDNPDVAILKLDRPIKKYFRLNARKDAPSGLAVWTCGYPGIAQAAQSDAEAAFISAIRTSSKNIAMRYTDKEFIYSLYQGHVGRSYPEPPFNLYYKVEHDAQMAEGNSGGPLLDEQGTVIGINTLYLSRGGKGPSFNISLSIGSLRSFIEQAGQFVEWAE